MGTIIFAATRGSPIFRVPAEGGTPVAVTSSRPALNLSDLGSHRWAYFLPDGEHFLYLNAPAGACSEGDELHFASLDSKRDVSLMLACTSVAFGDGRIIYWRGGNLGAQPFDPGHGSVSGAPVAIAEHAAFDSSFAFSPFSASRDGKLLYVAGQGPVGAQLVWYDRTVKMLGTLGEATAYSSIAISPDGSRVIADTQQQRILLLDARGTRTLATLSGHFGPFPTWSADGRYMYFTAEANDTYGISEIATDGSGGRQTLVTFPKGQPGAAFLAASPDGKWLADESTQSGKDDVYITPFPGGGAQYQVSTNGGERPVWRHDGKELFYRENLTLMSVKVNTGGRAVELGPPAPLFEVAARNLNGRWYAVSPDGRFLMNTTPPSAQTKRFELVVNWPAELNK